MYKYVTKYKIKFAIPIIFMLIFTFFISDSYSDNGAATFRRPAKVVIVSGDLQSGKLGSLLPEPLTVKLLGEDNLPTTFWEVTFAVVSGGGKVSWDYIKPANEIKVVANYQGIASANLTLGNTKTINQVKATFESLTPAIFTATVDNSPPTLQPIGNKEINEGALLKFKVSATDPNSDDTLALSASPLPSNASFDPLTGIFSFTPDYTQAGIYNVTFAVSDGFANDSEKITITVKNVNQPPVLNPIGNRIVDEGSELAILISANDPDGDTLIYSALGLPTGATFDPATRIFKWRPGFNVAPLGGNQNFNLIFMAKDPVGASVSEEVKITVSDVQPLVPDIRLMPIASDNQPTLDFGIVEVSELSDRIFQIHNDGNDVLVLTSIKTTDGQFKPISYLKTNSAPIDAIDPLVLQLLDEATIIGYLKTNSVFEPVKPSLQNPLMTIDYPTLNPGECLLIKAQFKPLASGLKQGNFIIESNDPDEAIILMKVLGNATQTPDIRVSSNSINFGDVSINVSLTIPLKIYNDGKGVLKITGITTDDLQFTASSYSDVNPAGEITVNIKFTPTSIGAKTATLRITSNDPDESVILVALRGNAFRAATPDIDVTTTSINFGEVEVGQSFTKQFQISNIGDAILLISSITSSNSQFAVLNSANVPASSQVTISVKFTPVSSGTKAGIITINSNDPDESLVVVSVQGVGIVIPKPNIRISPIILDFGDVVVGESLIKNFYIYNDGLTLLQISSIASNNQRFTVLDNSNVFAGGYELIRVKFEPQALGSIEGKITVTSNDPDEPSKQITVQGKGVNPPSSRIRISPTSIDFGEVQVTKSLTKEFRIYNDGVTTLTVSNMTSNNNQFTPIFSNIINVSPGNYATVSIRFMPSTIGLKTATITITSNDPDNPTKTLSVQGTGFIVPVPQIEVLPASLDYGEVNVNSSLTSGFYIHNNGNATLQITSITSNNTQFSVTTSIANIIPDYMAPVAVRFAPNSVGFKTAKITIVSNDLNTPSVVVMVYGDGIYPGLPVIGVWNQISQANLPNDLNDVFFIDVNKGWIVGYNGVIASSLNGGNTWTPQYSGTNRYLNGVFFTDTNNGWSVGQLGTMLKTTNGGTNWSSPGTGISNSLESVVFTDSSKGWTVGDFGSVMGYNGLNWGIQNSNTSFDLRDVDFVSIYQGWAVGNNGTIVRTNDGGQTWTPQSSNTNYALNGVDFVNSYEGWAVGSGGIILHTQNGGQTWGSQNSNSNYTTLMDVKFLSSTVGWVVGQDGVIVYTVDGGLTWIRIDSGVSANLNAVYFKDPDNGWIVGANGTILKYVPGYPSSITSVSVSGSPAHAGGVIKIKAVGQPRNNAKFSIVGVVANVAMTENPPGTYAGIYNVPDSGINIIDAPVVVSLTNKYGNTATNSSKSVTIDTTSIIESASVSPNPAKLGDTVTVTANGESGGTAKFTIAGVVSDVLMAEVLYTSGRYIGEYKVSEGVNATNVKVTVTLVDELGNTATKEAGLLTIDTVAQIGSVTINGSPAGLGKPITVTMTGEAKSIAKLSIGDLTSNMAMTESSSGVYIGIYTVPQGVYAKNALVSVRLTDPIGNIATKNAGYVTVDTLCKIDLVTISGSPGRGGGNIVVEIAGDPSGSAKFTIAGITGEKAMSELTVGSGKYSGSYTIPANVNVNDAVVTVTLVDALGNVAIDTSHTVTIDNIVPAINSVEVSGSPGRAGGKINVSMVGEPKARAKFTIGGIADENMREQPAGSGNYTGSYTIFGGINIKDAIVTVTLVDSAGNVATDTIKKVTIDNTAPKINTIAVAGSPGRVGGKIDISMVGEPNGVAKFKIGNVADNNMTEQPVGSGNYLGSYTIPDSVNVKDAILTVTLADLAGNIATDMSKKVTIDNVAPKINSVTVEGSPGRGGGKITANMVGEPSGVAKFKIDGMIDNNMTEQPVGSGNYTGSYTIPDNISINDAIVTVTLADSAGNATIDTSKKVTLDSVAPNIESVTVAGSPGRVGGKITVSMVGEVNARAKFTIHSVQTKVSIADENMQEQPAGSGKYTGSYTILDGVNVKDAIVTVTLIDLAGNVATDASQNITIDNTAPKIDSVNVTGSPGHTGGKITVDMEGESNGKAVFSIAEVTLNQPMIEQSSGKYNGIYTIPSGINVTNAVLTVTLTDLTGNASTDKTQSVTIDTSGPKITSLNISGSPAKVNETITITLVGEMNNTAQFSIANVVQNVLMIESNGTYTGNYIVTEDKNVTNAKLTVTLKDSIGNTTTDTSKTISIIPSWDVNRDGSIDTADIITIGKSFGQKVTGKNEADVNGDGVVDILDLIIVCQHFSSSQASTAPSMELRTLNDDQLNVIKHLYKYVSDFPSNESDIVMTKELLGRLIAQNIPKIANSQLMQNYPNPFNPETWIPYKLSNSGTVTISIYSTTGQLVRKIDLGYKEIGDYSARDKAVYWDGKNDVGEEVTSGIYFYSIKSGDFTAVKKMIISR
jgi:photosystem II stability/assembly factor-like uncharacterized protein